MLRLPLDLPEIELLAFPLAAQRLVLEAFFQELSAIQLLSKDRWVEWYLRKAGGGRGALVRNPCLHSVQPSLHVLNQTRVPLSL